MNYPHTKKSIAAGRGVTDRTVTNWIYRGLLPPGIKMGAADQARVRFSDEDVKTLDRNLAALNGGNRPAAA